MLLQGAFKWGYDCENHYTKSLSRNNGNVLYLSMY